MSDNLPILSKHATELAEKAQHLAHVLEQAALAPIMEAQHATSDSFISLLTIFILACFVGYYVVWKVTPALHTPLMSVTNAISGVIIVGSMLAAGSSIWDSSTVLGITAVFLASINIFGGFIVTTRMLAMFKKK